MATFIHAGDFLINVERITYVDLNPEPGEKVLHVYFAGADSDEDGVVMPHLLELSDNAALSFLNALEGITRVQLKPGWLKPPS